SPCRVTSHDTDLDTAVCTDSVQPVRKRATAHPSERQFFHLPPPLPRRSLTMGFLPKISLPNPINVAKSVVHKAESVASNAVQTATNTVHNVEHFAKSE